MAHRRIRPTVACAKCRTTFLFSDGQVNDQRMRFRKYDWMWTGKLPLCGLCDRSEFDALQKRARMK